MATEDEGERKEREQEINQGKTEERFTSRTFNFQHEVRTPLVVPEPSALTPLVVPEGVVQVLRTGKTLGQTATTRVSGATLRPALEIQRRETQAGARQPSGDWGEEAPPRFAGNAVLEVGGGLYRNCTGTARWNEPKGERCTGGRTPPWRNVRLSCEEKGSSEPSTPMSKPFCRAASKNTRHLSEQKTPLLPPPVWEKMPKRSESAVTPRPRLAELRDLPHVEHGTNDVITNEQSRSLK